MPSNELAVQKIQMMVQDIQANYLASAAETTAGMAETILDATSFDEMFDESNVPEKLLDVPLLVTEITFNQSTYQGGIPYYATFRGNKLGTSLVQQEPFLFNCSGWQPVVVAYKCIKEKWLPRNLIFKKSERATAAGFHPITVRPYREEEVEEPF